MAAQVKAIVEDASDRFDEAEQKLDKCNGTATEYETCKLYVDMAIEQCDQRKSQDPVASTAATGQSAVVPSGQRSATGAASHTAAIHPAHLQAALKHAAAAVMAAGARVGGRPGGGGGVREGTSVPKDKPHKETGRKLLEASAQGGDEVADAATAGATPAASAHAAGAGVIISSNGCVELSLGVLNTGGECTDELIAALKNEEKKLRNATTQSCQDAKATVSTRRNRTSSC